MKKLISVVLFFSVIRIQAEIPSQYHSNKDLENVLREIARSQIVTLSTLTKTKNGNDLWLLSIGKNASQKGILYVGGIEGNRLAGTEHLLRFAEGLVGAYGKVDSVTALLNSTTLYIIPRANPDAAESYFIKPLRERITNETPWDDDRDGKTDEDDTEDLNGDGVISMMRILDRTGEWIEHPDDPRIMKKADRAKGEKGMYRLYSEGIDNDHDDAWNEDGAGGVDLNRNFTYNYEYFAPTHGIHQISEKETKAIADFLFDHQNISVVFTFSSLDNLTKEWKNEPSRGESRVISSVDKSDEKYFKAISKKFMDLTKLKEAPSVEKGSGSFCETAYYHAGRWSFSVPDWWAGEIISAKDSTTGKDSSVSQPKQNKRTRDASSEKDSEIKTLAWYDALDKKDVFIQWSSFSHKDFKGKKVEIGGVRPYVMTNPPAESLNVIASEYKKFLEYLPFQLPTLEIAESKVEKLGMNTFRVSMTLQNTGYLPTNSALGVKTRWIRNITVKIDTKKNVVMTGKTKSVIGPIDGNGGIDQLSWVIVGSGSVDVSIECPTTGLLSRTIELKESAQ